VVWRQIAAGLALFGVYLLVDGLDASARRAAARTHGRDLFSFEQHLHLDIEHTLNDWLAPHHTLSVLANYEYAYTYVLSALALMVWVIVRRPDLWSPARDSFVVLNLLAFACFALYPVAPPRMLPELGFVDTVTRGGTVGSWGSGLVDAANQIAAMPSLHVGWALWVSVVLGRISARRSIQVLSAVHVLLTLFVVMATANHYLLDGVVVVLPVVVGVRVASWIHHHLPGEQVMSSDAFFVHVEATGAAQHVGGFVVFDPVDDAVTSGRPTLAELRELARTELLPPRRFRQRQWAPSRWRRLRWVETEVDLDEHVTEEVTEGGPAGLRARVAEYAARPLPVDRPRWRMVIVRDAETGRSALLFLLHHSMADGIGTIIHSLSLFRPRTTLGDGEPSPGALRVALAATVGLAQLATDGTARRVGEGGSGRAYATLDQDLAAVRRLARDHGVRMTDLVLGLLAAAISRVHPELAVAVRERLRVAVPLMVRAPGAAPEGNATAAVMLDLPLDGRPLPELLTEIGRRTRKLRTPTRALASRFVMATGLRLLPEPAARWFARTVYGGRFFHGIVSNLPGPTPTLTMAGAPTEGVYPILPLAPAAPLALGAMSWGGSFGWGLAVDPAVLDADRIVAEVGRLAAELAELADMAEGDGDAERAGSQSSSL